MSVTQADQFTPANAPTPGATKTEALRCEVLTDLAAARPLAAEWDAFLLAGRHELYLTYDWCAAWWAFYGQGRRLRVYVYRAGGRIVAILPMFVERVWLGPVWLKLAKFVGADFSLQMCTPAVEAAHAPAVYNDLLERLVQTERVDAIWFAPLSGANDAATPLRRACYQREDLVSVRRDRVLAPHTLFTLPESFDAYINGMNKRQKQNYRRDNNLFSKTFKIRVDTITDGPEALSEFDRFKVMHDGQWAAQNKLGHFGDWPRSEAFNQELIRRLAPQGRYRLVRVWADDKVVSYQFSFRFGDTYYWRLPARAPETDWDRYGLGRMGLIKMIEVAIGEGVRHIEGGAGHYDYKVQLGAVEHPLGGLLAVANGGTAGPRSWAFGHLSDALHLAYYRAYFIRYADRLPIKRKPLWKTWIKSHL